MSLARSASPTPAPGVPAAVSDSTLTGAYIAAIVAFTVFALDRAVSLYTHWRDREREGVEMLTEGLSSASIAMIRAGSADLPDAHAELGMVGTRVQLRITRRRNVISSLILFAIHASTRARNSPDFSDAAKLHFMTGLYALLGDELVRWHQFKTSAKAVQRKVVVYVSEQRDATTGMTDTEADNAQR
jgi:hypothetical protein